MQVNVYGKLDGTCDKCEAAKAKLNRLGIAFESFELSDAIVLHDGWREDETVQVMATYSDIQTYPVIAIDGKALSYPEAMKFLKPHRKPKAAVHQPMLNMKLQEEQVLSATG